MSVLIITERDDIHGSALIWALKQCGVRCDRWCLSDFPEQQRSSLHISPSLSRPSFDISGIHSREYKSIWTRRVSDPRMISNELAVADREMAFLQARRHADALRTLFSPDSIWINPPETRVLANIKPYQLLAAGAVGFAIPETLLSNDPEAIRGFFQKHNGEVIYKAFTPAFWRDDAANVVRCLFTSKLTEDALVDDEALTSCPGIYQPYVPKRADIRITFFGQTYCGVRIHSQAVPSGSIDFRSDMKFEAPIEEFELAPAFLERCIALSSKLGLLHGSYDFVERPDGGLTFLEVNEMGQFLWLEERLPQLPLLEMFAAFSLDPRPDFVFTSGQVTKAKFGDFLKTDEYVVFRRDLTESISTLPFLWTE